MKKELAYKNAMNLYDKLLPICFHECNNIKNETKEDMAKEYDPSDLPIKGYRFIDSKKEDKEKSKSQPEETFAQRVKLRRQKADDKDLTYMPSLEGDEEEVKEGKGIKTLTPNKL